MMTRLALAFTDHTTPPRGPITRSLFKASDKLSIPRLFTSRPENWDAHDLILWFHNKPPKMKTRARVAWWMCDLRPPEVLRKYGPSTANMIFLSNEHYLDAYSKEYRVPTHYLPQCGIDDPPLTKGFRDIVEPCVFIGAVPTIIKPEPYDYHNNRKGILDAIEAGGFPVRVINNERVTPDQRIIYAMTQFSLAISTPVQGYTSNRLYNILSSKGFCVTLKFPGIERMFENHKHLVWFDKADEAVDVMRHYTEKPEERVRIRRLGYREYLRNHTAVERLRRVVEIVRSSV